MLAERLYLGRTVNTPGHPGSESALDAEIAHELANMMTVLLGSLEQLRRQPLDQQGRGQLERAEWGARHVARLTRHTLFRTQGWDDTDGAVDLNAVVNEFTTTIDSRINGGAQVTAKLAPGSLPVRLDAGLLDLVLLNLVRNLMAAMPGGGEVVVRTRGPRLDGLGEQLTAEVSVSDTGAGMPPDVARCATDTRFTTKQQGRDGGLGLWMAHSLASAYGGKVSIEPALGQGTAVRLVFPYAGEAAQG